MKLLTTFKRVLSTIALSAVAIAALGTHGVQAIPYSGDSTPSADAPAFNVYTGVPSVGDESRFFNGRLSTETNNDARDPINVPCETGTKFVLRAYVHNGADQAKNNDGNGPSVAKNSKIRVTMPAVQGASFTPSATISASNATSVTDSVSITCTNANGKVYTIKYVTGSAQQYNPISGVQNLSDNIVTTGAPIGTMTPNGDMWGCWDQRVWVRLEVELVEVEQPKTPATCDLLTLTQVSSDNKKRYTFAVASTANNATVNNVRFVVTNSSNQQVATQTVTPAQLPYTYEFPSDGAYRVVATLLTTLNGVTQEITSDNCAKDVSINTPQVLGYKCDAVSIIKGANRSVAVKVAASTTGNAAVVRYTVDFGDGTTKTFNKNENITHSYKEDKTYTVNVKITYLVDGKEVTKEEICASNVNFTSAPTIITETGTGSLAALFTGTTIAGTALHTIKTRRSLRK